MDNNKEYKKQLNKEIIKIKQELKYRKERLYHNIFAGTCHKSQQKQRSIIFDLELQKDYLEYKYQHNLK